MPDFIQDPTLPPEPIAPQQPLPDNYRGGVQAPAKAIDPFDHFVQNGMVNLPTWASPNSIRMSTPYKTRLDQTLRYTDPELGFTPLDPNLEDEYAHAHPIATFRNNILQSGARFLGAAAESIATIPLFFNAAFSGGNLTEKANKLYNNDFTNTVDGLLKTLDTKLPVYQTNYERDHPIAKYLAFWKPTAFAGAMGSVVNNMGFMAGAIAGSLVEDAAITALTGGMGLFPALASNAAFITKLGRASRALAEEPEQILALSKLTHTADELLPAITNDAALMVRTEGGAAVRSTGDNIASQAIDANEVLGSAKTNRIAQDIINNDKYFKIRNAVKYNLALLSSGMAIGAFQSADIYHRSKQELAQRYFDINGTAPQGDDLRQIDDISMKSANIAMGANVALTYLTTRLNFGSLFKPTQQAFDETLITGWGKSIGRTKIERSALDEAGKFKYNAVTTSPESIIGKILLNGQKIGNKLALSSGEGLQFLSMGSITETSLDYSLKKYDAENRGEVANYMDSFLKGIEKNVSTNEGISNIMLGVVMGAFGTPLLNKARAGRGQLSPKEQMTRAAEMLNSSQLKFNIDEATTQVGFAKDHKKAVDAGDEKLARDIRQAMLENWVISGAKANAYRARVEELNAIRDLEGKSFESYWNREDTPANRQEINSFIDNIQRKAERINDNYTRISRLTKNPFNPKKQPNDYEAYETYKEQLAVSLSRSQDKQERLKAVRDKLSSLSPGLDIQNAVDLTTIGGLRNIAKKLDSAVTEISKQLGAAEEAGTDKDVLDGIRKKHSDLNDLFKRTQEMILDTKVDANGNILESGFNGEKYVNVLQDLYKLHTGGSFESNRYLDEQKRISDGKTFHLDDSNKVSSADELATALQDLQDIYSLGRDNLNVQRMYNYLRSGKGADDYMNILRAKILENQQKFVNDEGQVKTLEELHNEIEEETRFDQGETFDMEEATKQQREDIRTAAKKVVNNEELTGAEKELSSRMPNRFANEVKIQELTKKKVDDRFGSTPPDDTITPDPTHAINVKDIFGMYSPSSNSADHRNNLYNAIFKDDAILGKLTARYDKPTSDAEPTYTNVPNTKLYRRTFANQENISIYHDGKPVGILRPPTSMWLDANGKRSIFDLKEGEYKDVTGNDPSTYKDFMQNLTDYQTAYDKLRNEMQANPDKQFTYADINKYFDLTINAGSSVQNRYTLEKVNKKYRVINPTGVVVKTASTEQSARDWIAQNNNKLARFDTLLKDLNYKPKGTALVSFIDTVTVEGRQQVSKKSKEGVIVNRDELTPEQAAKLEAFLEKNADMLSANINRYAIILPVDGEYIKKGILFARNAETTSENRAEYFNTLKEAASGTLSGDNLKAAMESINNKYFLANNDRTTKQTFIVSQFDKDGNFVLQINNPSLKVFKTITIPREALREVDTYGDFINKLQGAIDSEAQNAKGLAKLQVELTEDSLKRQIPNDEKINSLKQVENVLKVATSQNIFKNFNINFNPKNGESTTVNPEVKPITPKQEEVAKQPEVKSEVDNINKEYAGKLAQLHSDFSSTLTPKETAIKNAIAKDKSLASNPAALLKVADATSADLQGYVKKASNYNEAYNVYKAIQRQKLDNLTNISKPVFAKTKEGINVIAKDLFGLDAEQASAVAEIYDANAKAWANRTGKSVNDYYKQLGFKSQLEEGTTNILEQVPAIQKVIDYLKLQPKKISVNKTGYVSENGSVGINLANRIGEVIKEQGLEDLVGARWNKTDQAVEFFPIDRQGVLFQPEAKGAYEQLTNTIYALTSPDVTTPLHELAHSWEPLLTPAERTKILDWAKTKDWSTETSEKFASGFEQYLSEGKASTPELKSTFDKFADWLKNIVQKVRALFGNDFALNDNMRNIYTEMLNGKASVEPVVENSVTVALAKNNTGDVYTFNIQNNNKEVGALKAVNDGQYLTVNEANVTTPRQGIGIEAYRQAGEQAIADGLQLRSDSIKNRLSEPAKGLWEKLVANGEAIKGEDNYIYTGLTKGNKKITAVEEFAQNPHQLIPDDNIEYITNDFNGDKYYIITNNPYGNPLIGTHYYKTFEEATTALNELNVKNGFAEKQSFRPIQDAILAKYVDAKPSDVTMAETKETYLDRPVIEVKIGDKVIGRVFKDGKRYNQINSEGKYGFVGDTKAETIENLVDDYNAANSLKAFKEIEAAKKEFDKQPEEHITSPIESNTDYGKVRIVQEDIGNGYYEKQIKEGKLTADEAKAIIKSAGLNPTVVEGMEFRIKNPDLIKAFKEKVPTEGINITYLRSDLNNAIKDGRFGEAIRNGDIEINKAKEILEYFRINQDRFKDDFDAAQAKLEEALAATGQQVELSPDELDFINKLKTSVDSIKGSTKNAIKDLLDSEDYKSILDYTKELLTDDAKTAKSFFNNDATYEAFKKLTGVTDESSTAADLLKKHGLFEPEVDEQPKPPSEKYVTYKERGPDDTIIEKYGRVIEEGDFTTTILDSRGNTIDRLTSALQPATAEQFNSQKTHIPTAKYNVGDKVTYGADKTPYTIVDSEQRPRDDGKTFDTFYTTEEGVLISEAGIQGFARNTEATKVFKIRAEHTKRFNVLKRISSRFETLFPQIKTDIGYFDFDAPARFNKGRVEINLGYADQRYTAEQIRAFEQADPNNVPWLKRESVAHEYMHPFIVALKDSNRSLYESLTKEISANKEIMQQIDNLVKKGTYKETDRIDEGLAIWLGKEVTKAFNKDGTFNESYVAERKNSLVQRFFQWMQDILNYLTGKKKTPTLEQFVKDANADAELQRKNIRKLIKDVPELEELHNTKFGRDLTKTIAFVKKNSTKLEEAINSNRKVAAQDIDATKLSKVALAVEDLGKANSNNRFEFIERVNDNDAVEFDEADPNHIKVYIDPTFADQLSLPSVLQRYADKIKDSEAAREEFIDLVQRNFYKAGNNKTEESIGVGSINPLMKLQDVSDYIVKQLSDSEHAITYDENQLKYIDELTAYMELDSESASKIRARIVQRLKVLKDTADTRLTNETLREHYNILNRLNLDETDTDFVLKYIQQGAVSINLAWRKFNELRDDLKDIEEIPNPTIAKAKLNRLNKELDVIKQLTSFYDDFSNLYNKYNDEFESEDMVKFDRAIANLSRIRDNMRETSIQLAVKWFMPYVEKHNEFIKKEGYTDPRYLLDEQTLYNNFKYGTNKDTNFITFSLGPTVTSRDPVNAVFSNIVADMIAVNNVNIVSAAFDISSAFEKFAKAKGIGVGDSKAQIQYYKDHYLRDADILVSQYDEASNSYKDVYVKKKALHQEFFFDKYEKDYAAQQAKYANPRSGDEAELFREALNKWKKDNNFGRSEKYRNPEYAKLQNDTYFKLLEKHYNESNEKYGENKLQFGIVPQKYDANILQQLREFVEQNKHEKGATNKYLNLKENVKVSLAGLRKDQSSLNLDDTKYRRIKSNLNNLKKEENVDLNLHTTMTDFITEATNYGSLKEVQYNAENLRMLIEGNTKFSIPARKIGQEDFEAKIRKSAKLRKAKIQLDELQALKDAGKEYDIESYDRLSAKLKAATPEGLEQIKNELSKLQMEKDAGITDNEARYNMLKSAVNSAKAETSLWDKFAGTIKPSETNRLNEQLRQFINDSFYGESVEDAKLGSISLNKAARYISMYTSINSMAFNSIAGISNIVIGDVQMLVEGNGGKYYNKKELVKAATDYVKNIPEYMADLKNPIKSKDTQLSFLLDAIQGEVLDEFGNRISGNIAKRMFNPSSLFFFTSLGEHQIQITGMKAMLLGRKVETTGGQKISLYDAFIKDADGRYSLRKDLKNFNSDDLQHFIRQLHSVNRSLNGNYSDLHKGTLQRKWYGTLALKFRKYIYEAFRTRFSSEHTDYEKNTVDVGYLRYFFKDYLYNNVRSLLLKQASMSDVKGNLKLKGLDPHQLYAVRKATMEVGIYLGITLITAALFGGTQKKDLSPAEKAILLYSLRLRNDLGMYHASMFSEIKQQLKNPTASLTTSLALADTFSQLMSPNEVYKTNSHSHKAGDSKLLYDIKKLTPILSKFPIDFDNKLSYFNLVNQNIEGVSQNQNAN